MHLLVMKGPKNIKCLELQKLTNKKVFFIDDLPNQISSVSKTVLI